MNRSLTLNWNPQLELQLNEAQGDEQGDEPQEVLTGHEDNTEFALAMCQTKPFVLFGGKDKSVVKPSIVAAEHISQTDSTVPNIPLIANCKVVNPGLASAEHISQVLTGHKDNAEFAISMSQTDPFVLFEGKDKSVVKPSIAAVEHISQAKLNQALSGPVEARLDGANNETWSAIKKHLQCVTQSVASGLSSSFSGFDMDDRTKEQMLENLANYAKVVVAANARQEAGRVLIPMKDRMLFGHDADSIPRICSGKEKIAHSASLKLLSEMAAIHSDDDADNTESTPSSALMDTKNNAAVTVRSITTFDPLASSTWDEIDGTVPNTLLIANCEVVNPVAEHILQIWRMIDLIYRMKRSLPNSINLNLIDLI